MKNVLKGLFFYQLEHCAGPPADIYETDEDLVYEIDLPGVNPEDVSIRVFEDLLIIESAGTDFSGENRLKYLCMERDNKGFRRVLKIPVSINVTAAEALYSNGVITVRFPKLKGKLLRIRVERKQ